MKLESMRVTAARVQDYDTGAQYLRLSPTMLAWVWYKPTEEGFELVTDEQADELEAAFEEMLERSTQ